MRRANSLAALAAEWKVNWLYYPARSQNRHTALSRAQQRGHITRYFFPRHGGYLSLAGVPTELQKVTIRWQNSLVHLATKYKAEDNPAVIRSKECDIRVFFFSTERIRDSLQTQRNFNLISHHTAVIQYGTSGGNFQCKTFLSNFNWIAIFYIFNWCE